MSIIIRILNDPTLAMVGSAAARRGQELVIAVSAGLSFRERRVAALDLMTDDEFEDWVHEQGLVSPIFRSVPVQTPTAASPYVPSMRDPLDAAAPRRAV